MLPALTSSLHSDHSDATARGVGVLNHVDTSDSACNYYL